MLINMIVLSYFQSGLKLCALMQVHLCRCMFDMIFVSHWKELLISRLSAKTSVHDFVVMAVNGNQICSL